jgi:hypothetical protein
MQRRGLGTPVQGKADDGQGEPVIRRIAEEIERVGAQADGSGNQARDDLDQEHRHIQAERDPRR